MDDRCLAVDRVKEPPPPVSVDKYLVCCTDELAERGRVKRETQGHPAKVPISCPGAN